MRTARSWQGIPLAAVLAVAPALAGCKQKAEGQAALPPASGPGAPPAPALPKLERGAGVGSTTVAASEGKTTGTTYPRAEAQVGPNGQGVIAKINFKEGDRVRRGGVLFRLDTGDAALRVEQAKTALAAAKVNLSATETEYKRTRSLFDQKAVNSMQWDQMQARMDGARVGVEQAEVALRMASKMLADATVRSPIDGVVAMKLKNEGEMATMMPPTIVLVVQDQSVLELRFRLSERDLARVRVGDTVTARFEALGETREARVVRVSPAVDPRTRTVEFVAEIPNANGALKSGLLAEVELGKAAAMTPPPPATAGRRAPPEATR